MDHTLISQDTFTVVGYSRRIDPARPESIGELWTKFREQDPKEGIANRTNDDVWAVYHEYEGDHSQAYRLLIGYRVDQVGILDEGLELATVPASYYAMYFAQGKLPEAIQDTWSHIHQAGLDRKFTGDFEVYGRFAQDPSDAEVPIFVSVEDPD